LQRGCDEEKNEPAQVEKLARIGSPCAVLKKCRRANAAGMSHTEIEILNMALRVCGAWCEVKG
jgi:hypothetical protein